MNTTPTDTRSPWTRWKGLLALSVATSIGLNVWHAVETSGYGSAVLASIAPLFLFWITHNLVTDPGGVKGWREDKVGVCVAALVTLGAFTVSYVTQRDLALRFGMELLVAMILPLIVDLTIAVASYKLVREAEQLPRDRSAYRVERATEQVPAAPPVPAEQQVEQPAVVEQEPWSTSVEQPAPSAPQLLREPVEQLVAHPLTWDDSDTAPITTQLVERPAEQVTVTPPVSTEQPVEQPAPAAPQPLHEQLEQPVIEDTERPAEHRATAERLVEQGRFSQPVELLERALALRSAGQSQRAIADALGIGATTVGRIHKAADEITALVPTA